MSAISCSAIDKAFGDQSVLRDLSLEIRSGELFSLLGPSGCGKSTLLRIIAGLEQPDRGTVKIDGADVTSMPPHRRGIGMVFQQYALFPHLTVAENISFGLEVRKVPKAEQADRLRRALGAVRLEGLGARYPDQLSGGQQQRVAVARALAIEPRVILLDEPLSNLDAKLRTEVRQEIRALHIELGLTTVHVTHDQEEALSISDRIAVMFNGRIAQIGTPEELYEQPASLDIASFLGETNIISGTLSRKEKGEGGGEISLPHGLIVRANSLPRDISPGSPVAVMFRPERVHAIPDTTAVPPDSTLIISGKISERRYSGPSVRLVLTPDATGIPELTAMASCSALQVGEDAAFCLAGSALTVLAADPGGT